jgi:hypothetical protein
VTTIYGTALDTIGEGVLRDDAQREMYRLMETVKPGDLTACEVIAVLAIFRGAKERLEAQPAHAGARAGTGLDLPSAHGARQWLPRETVEQQP